MQTVIERRKEIKRLIEGRSMFSRLFTYRGRENVNPEENFFTEGLAYILDKDRNLLQKLVEHIQNKFPDENLLKGFYWKKAEVRTQSFYRNLSGRHNFIDLEIEFEEALLWLEVKVESGPSGEDQIIRYEELMGESDHIDHDRSGIVLLTKYEVIPDHKDKYYAYKPAYSYS
ncbi:MAG: PD-(D/E)XK nuclease family protein [Candidatus Marinimicrobia bacterium]|nr:PD-(D/E)XK nuclease family protein [Candidatus Neomarinimicrobiota bacterium]